MPEEFKKTVPAAERRRYQRLDHIFPVEFRLLDRQNQPVSPWHQAFTQDICDGGLCLTVNHLEVDTIAFFEDRKNLMSLAINIPIGAESVTATAHPVWLKKVKDEPADQYLIGLSYEKIDPMGNRRILRYASVRRFLKATAIIFSLGLCAGLVLSGFYNIRLRYAKEKLINSLTDKLVQQSILTNGRDTLRSRIDEMKFSLSQSGRKVQKLEKELSSAAATDREAIETLTRSLAFSKNEQGTIKNDIAAAMVRQAKAEDEIKTKTEEVSLLEKKILDKLYGWLKVHQNNDTGLLSSFEGDEDISDWGFTYDEALAAIVFTGSGDVASARKIFEFYLNAQKSDSGGFVNAYYASTGEPSEYTAHAGPNIWLGLAVLQYTRKTKDMKYLGLARDIAAWLETIKDSEGGLRGGKSFSWYSTEHNLDAYAFYNLFYSLTKEETYKKEAQKTLQWLNKNAYSKMTGSAVKRGKGDATIATDTYAWSISAIGPQALIEIGMDPDAIMDFAIAHCSVTVDYQKPGGPSVRVQGFDFSKAQHLARGGIISCEWTAQMILAFKVMADHYGRRSESAKAHHYSRLADFYTGELSQMIITSPSPLGQGEFCLPYASAEFSDTGHGWRTPKGNRTGSVAATAYTILAIEDLNPLSFND